MDLQSLVISQAEAMRDPRYLVMRSNQTFPRFQQAKSNWRKAVKALLVARKVYRHEKKNAFSNPRPKSN